MMSRKDYEHLAQVGLSLRSALNDEDFDRYIDRMIWAIHASPGGSKHFDEGWFRKRCKGESQ